MRYWDWMSCYHNTPKTWLLKYEKHYIYVSRPDFKQITSQVCGFLFPSRISTVWEHNLFILQSKIYTVGCSQLAFQMLTEQKIIAISPKPAFWKPGVAQLVVHPKQIHRLWVQIPLGLPMHSPRISVYSNIWILATWQWAEWFNLPYLINQRMPQINLLSSNL